MKSANNNDRMVQPYLFFNGRCEQAIEFYRQAVGAEISERLRVKDSPEPCNPPGGLPAGYENRIMHCNLRIGGTSFMASDGCSTEPQDFQGFTLTLTVPNEAEADRAFGALADGGKVKMPLARTFWSPRFGVVEDRFGVGWMVMVQPNGKK
jgi:PhnB protein